MMGTVYRWFTEASWRSWYAHALAATALTYLPVAAYNVSCRVGFDWWGYGIEPTALAALTGTGAFLYYAVKEMGDEIKHRSKGEWKKRANIDRVSWASDGKADLVGPFAVWIGALAAWMV